MSDEDGGAQPTWRVASVLATPELTTFVARLAYAEENFVEPSEQLELSTAGDGDVFLHAYSEGDREGNAKIVLPRRVAAALHAALGRMLERKEKA